MSDESSSKDKKDFFRCAVNFNGSRTTISLDGLLVEYLAEKLGGEDRVRGWAKETVVRLESEWAEAARNLPAGTRFKESTGLSRAVAREAFKELLGKRERSAPVLQVVRTVEGL